MNPGNAFQKGYLFMVLSILLIVVGAWLYFGSRQKQADTSAQLVVTEQKAQSLLQLNTLLLSAQRDKRGYLIDRKPHHLLSYRKVVRESDASLQLIQERFRGDSLQPAVEDLTGIFSSWVRNWEQQLQKIAALAPAAEEESINRIFTESQLSPAEWENQLKSVQQQLENRSKHLQERWQALVDQNNSGFVVLLFAVAGLLSWSFFSIQKQEFLKARNQATLQLNEAVRASQQEFISAFQYASIGMALVSVEGKFTKVNSSLCKLLGYTAAELTGLTFQEITHPDDLYKDLGYVEKMLAGEIDSYSMEKRYFHKDMGALSGSTSADPK